MPHNANVEVEDEELTQEQQDIIDLNDDKLDAREDTFAEYAREHEPDLDEDDRNIDEDAT